MGNGSAKQKRKRTRGGEGARGGAGYCARQLSNSAYSLGHKAAPPSWHAVEEPVLSAMQATSTSYSDVHPPHSAWVRTSSRPSRHASFGHSLLFGHSLPTTCFMTDALAYPMGGMPEVRAMHLRTILTAQREIMACGPDLQRVMELVVRQTQDLTKANGAAIELVEGEELVYRAASGTAEPFVGLRLAIQGSLSGRCVRERHLMECPDADDDERVDRSACARIGVRSMVVVPLFHENTCMGVLKVMSPEPRRFYSGDVALLELMAGFIAAAMSHAQAHRALAASEKNFRVFAEMAEDGIITIDERGRVVFVNRASETMFGRSRKAMLGASLLALMPERHRKAHAKAMARRPGGIPSVVIGQTLELHGLHQSGREFPIELSVSSFRTDEGVFFAGIVRDITDRKALEQAALDALRIDPLTSLLVRAAGSAELAREADRARRYDHPLGICLFDVDHFKRVNDVHGHAAGDLVLARVGEVLRQTIRVMDVAIRWGGEELLLVTPETDNAVHVAERVRLAVAALCVEPAGSITISGGVATYRRGEPIAETIARADASLYQAKSQGRNRIVGE